MTEVRKLFQGPFPVDETYYNMAKILLAAAYSTKANTTMNLVQPNFVLETSMKLRGHEVPAICVGFDPTDSPPGAPKFADTKSKPAGSLTSMLFWSQDQVKFLYNDHPRTVVYGPYGCGKSILIIEKLRRYLRRVEKKNEENCEDNQEVSVEKPRAMFISCLNPNLKNSWDEFGNFITPIFDTTIKAVLDEMAQTEGYEILFENAESVCKKMNVSLSRKNFYSKLPEFIKGKVSQFQF